MSFIWLSKLTGHLPVAKRSEVSFLLYHTSPLNKIFTIIATDLASVESDTIVVL